MADLGFFDGQRVELIGGEIVEVGAQTDEHAFSIRLVHHALIATFGSDAVIRIRSPLRLRDDSEPEPDIAHVQGTLREVRTHTKTALLVVEVSDTTLAYDRGHRASLYARAGIADYWIVNLVDRHVEVLRNPTPDPSTKFGWRYAATATHRPDETLTPLAAPAATVPVADLLP
jgi:Uma2 family endonuclease